MVSYLPDSKGYFKMLRIHRVKVFVEPVKILADLEVGDTFKIVRGFGEVMNCRVFEKYLKDNTVIAYVEQYGYSECFDSNDLVMVDQVQVSINNLPIR